MKFILSDELFQGFSVSLDKDDIESLEHVASCVAEKLKSELEKLHLEYLRDRLKQKNFHIHDFSLMDLLQGDDNATYYVCSGCFSK